MSKERRRHPRKVTAAKATVHDRANDCRYDTTTHDLSLGGAFLECDATELPAFGTDVEVHLAVGKEALQLPGIVRWAKPGGMGVQFGSLGARDTYVLTEFLSTLEDAPLP